MTERKNGIDRIRKAISKLNPLSEQQRLEHESEEIAREAVLLFANQETQEPLATYSADSDSVFELDKQKPGTIIRVTEQAPRQYVNAGKLYFTFFVIGNYNEELVNIFGIIPSMANDTEEFDKLILYPDWKLKKLSSQKIKNFGVNDAYKIFDASNRIANENANIITLDVMSAGKTVKEPERKSSTKATLVPVAETA